MKPAQFAHMKPKTLNEALQALETHGANAKVLAGGQSLVPMLNFRVLDPLVLIDLNGLAELDFLEPTQSGGIRIGALTRHYTLETSSLVRSRFPVLRAAMGYVAHLAIRNRGTIGGSLSHADPAAELPMMAVLLDAIIHTATLRSGRRTIAAKDFFAGALMTTLRDAELVVEVELPAIPEETGWAFEEVARRAGDFALSGVGVLIRTEAGCIAESRIAVMGVGEVPQRCNTAEDLLLGRRCEPEVVQAVVDQVREFVEPTTDLQASAEYRTHLVGVLVRRAVETAWARAQGEIA